MKQSELDKILKLHKKWINDEEDGVKADLTGAILINTNLSNTVLKGANLSSASLYDTIF